ncbi:winged helix-turn-helix domain-containing protein [Candidatus Liberibacter africanus]|uniref:Putative transcription regulator protein n=1 Tax=Candidatus Liberibacter africanus PTSAPSY TaxID=1277257 RepID=A0A0G3I524_LIBAF|nr:response regulator transcription factor [Candidatus Liberibacter africanus]AKK20375.1 putative transcription regulator protein [Candidatus Liberibacter africanus PTSAPSY]QTP64112.1 winged helix-turn-helix domain-containing protein [Candidatus Liberibacter africanus]
MFVLIDDRTLVKDGYISLFSDDGVSLEGFNSHEFEEWFQSLAKEDVSAIESFLIGKGEKVLELPRIIKAQSQMPLIGISDYPSLQTTLDFFDSGVDDVVNKPIHHREILARVAAIHRRFKASVRHEEIEPIRVFSDGRDPEVQGEVFPLPRRERRILEYLMANRGKRVAKTQIFSAIYGLFDDEVEENVVESHISKLRKKLRKKLGFDPVDSKRFLGYSIDWN